MPWWYYVNVTVHVLAALLWLGGMLFLGAVGAPALRAVEPPALRAQLFHALGVRFRRVGWACVAVLVATGVVNLWARGWLAGPTPPVLHAAFWQTGTGRALAAKLAAVIVMLVASAVHDFVLGPAAGRARPGTPDAVRLRRRAALLARVNALVGVALVAAAVRLARSATNIRPRMRVSPPVMLPIVAAGPPLPEASAGPSPADPSLPDLGVDDLPALLTAFYDDVAEDPLLAPYFAALDMAAHIPRIADFWATVLFHAGRYQGNAFRPHLAMPGLTPEHFARWLATLERTVDARHAGEGAERMKAVGHRIAYSMQLRLGLPPCAPYAADAPAAAVR